MGEGPGRNEVVKIDGRGIATRDGKNWIVGTMRHC